MCHGQVIGDAIRKARKPRKCHECGRTIEPGEKYRRYVWMESRGDPLEEQVQCPKCYALAHAFLQESDEVCYFVGEVRSGVRDIINGSAKAARAVRAHVKSAMELFK